MANELNLVADAGLTVVARLYQGGAQVGTDVAMTEAAGVGLYTGSVPGGTAAGTYVVVFFAGAEKKGAGLLLWDGTKEATPLTLAAQLAAQAAAIGAPMQAADYVAPPTAEAIAVQVETAIINEDDGRQVIKAIADKIKAEEVTATVIAQTVREELAPELARMDAPISSRSTLAAEDIPAGGLTTEQAQSLEQIKDTTAATFGQVGRLTN